MLISEIIKNETCPFCNVKIYEYICCNKFRVFKRMPIEICFDIKDIRFCLSIKEENCYFLKSLYKIHHIEMIIQDQDFLSFYNNLEKNLIFT